MENGYSKREIELMFENIKTLLQQIRSDIKTHSDYSEKRFKILERDIQDLRMEVDELKSFKLRALTIWGVIVTGITVVLNKFL